MEKRHAFGVYGNASAPPDSPAHYNSIRAAQATGAKIKAINDSVRVLMYWNSEIHFAMYECETEVGCGPSDDVSQVMFDGPADVNVHIVL